MAPPCVSRLSLAKMLPVWFWMVWEEHTPRHHVAGKPVGPTMNATFGLKPRWFQFNLRLLFVLPLVFAVVWWWLTLPHRTATEFVRLLGNGDVRAAKGMISGQQPANVFWTIVEANALEFDASEVEARRSYDYFAACQRFEVVCRWETRSAVLGEFIAQRHRVEAIPAGTGKKYLVYQPRGTSARDFEDFVSQSKTLYAANKNVDFRPFGKGVWVAAPHSRSTELADFGSGTKLTDTVAAAEKKSPLPISS